MTDTINQAHLQAVAETLAEQEGYKFRKLCFEGANHIHIGSVWFMHLDGDDRQFNINLLDLNICMGVLEKKIDSMNNSDLTKAFYTHIRYDSGDHALIVRTEPINEASHLKSGILGPQKYEGIAPTYPAAIAEALYKIRTEG